MRRIWIVGVALALAGGARGQFTDQERQGLASALFLSNLEGSDLVRLRSEKAPVWVRNGINDPSLGVEQWMALQAMSSQRSIAQLLGFARTKIYEDPESFEAGASPTIEIPVEVPEALRPSLKRLVESIHQSSEWVRQGLQKLSPAERRTLIEALPRLAVGSAPVKFEFVKQPLPEDSAVHELLAKVDLKWIRFAGHQLAADVQEEIAKLKEVAKTVSIPTTLKMTIEGVVVELSGSSNDTHAETDAVLCIDLGGNDRYTGRYGAGVGYSAVLIDLSGDDVYECPDLSIGAGVLGVGLAFDMGGDDRLRGRSLCFGAGIAGVGAMLKDGGEDDYRSTALAQGFGYLGIGILLDTKGDDHYRVGLMGQGAGKSNGMGWLIDKTGADTYRSGGTAQSPYLQGFTISMAQGAADGTGAVGCLCDLAGGDVYIADTKAQGYAAKESVAILMDAGGEDAYLAGNDAQASANLRGAGYLLDSGGDDSYTLRLGNGHAFAANQGLAILLDRAGNDLYAGHDSRPGLATANGAAVFLDSGGDDRYQGPPGVGSPARGSGSIAAFADLGGSDLYADGLANGQARMESNWGTALDLVGQPTKDDFPEPPKVGSKPIPDDAAMEAIYRRAKDDDRTAIDDFIAIGEPGLKWLLAKKLERADDEAIALIGWVAIQVGGAAEDLCVAAIDVAKANQAVAAIQICQAAGFQKAGPKIVEALDKPNLAKAAIRAAGALTVTEAVLKLTSLATDKNPDVVRAAVVALGQIGDERSLGVMEANIESAEPEIRFAAVSLLAKFPDRALPRGKALLTSSSEKSSRTGIELLAALGVTEALAEIGKALDDPRRGVKIQAMSALDGRCPRQFWPSVIELRKSSDPLVKAVASRMDLGR
jgi:hypothetical protein